MGELYAPSPLFRYPAHVSYHLVREGVGVKYIN